MPLESSDNLFYLWKSPKRRLQLKVLGLEEYYKNFLYHLLEGYISTFIGVHILVMLFHISLLIFFVHDKDYVHVDIGLYIISLLLVFLPLYCLYRKYQLVYHKHMRFTSMLPLLVLGIADIGICIYMSKIQYIQPNHASYIIYSIYLFMPIFELWICVCYGLLVTICYLSTAAYYRYENDDFVLIKLCSECIYLLNINLFGTFLRLLREIAIIEIFFGRWELVKQTIMYKYESEQEKNLLLSVIPANAANDLVNDIMTKRKILYASKHPEDLIDNFVIKPEKLYIKFHTDVSILYADIVNYTYLTTTLDVKPLVKTLHELFVSFDNAAVEYHCLRIKFLGDCYYCVSGIPEKNPDHAKSCVNLGLKMIEIIRDVRDRLQLNIDMRIGIHSGNVFAGIIGSAKWQYDIWSNDVDIANQLEVTGVPGVHVSTYTLTLLHDLYEYEKGPNEAFENQLLIKHNCRETFLIISLKKKSVVDLTVSKTRSSENLTTFSLATLIRQYANIREKAKSEMAQQFINHVPIGGWLLCSLFRKRDSGQDLVENSLFLNSFKDEMLFWHQPDLLLKYSCLTALLTYFGITFMEAINNPAIAREIISIEISIGYGVIMFWIIILWYQPIWNKIWQDGASISEVEYNQQTRNKLSNFIYNSYNHIICSLFWRIIIYISVVISNLIVILVGLSYCNVYERHHKLEERRKLEKYYKVCFNPWFVTEALVLTRSTNFLFVQIPYICKLLIDGLITLFYLWIMFTKYDYIYEFSETSNYGLSPLYAHFYVLIVLFILLNLMERQTEIFFKTDFKWKKRLQKKREQTLVSKATAKLLIENILPAHVATIYLGRKMTNELYTEKYDNVAIMFATLKNYEIGMVGLRVLNKIFCDFDEKLPIFNVSGRLRVEKIKVVGLTYMAACGLSPGYADNKRKRHAGMSGWNTLRQEIVGRDAINSQYEEHPYLNVFVLTEFALELMKTLRKFNMDYLSSSHETQEDVILRIGISHGEVMGGVVGSSKPFYDVWGNTINMASRMDSTGIEGRMQVTEETAVVLKSFNIRCDYRGLTYVKGREYIPTYFVGIDQKLKFIPRATNIPIAKFKPRKIYYEKFD